MTRSTLFPLCYVLILAPASANPNLTFSNHKVFKQSGPTQLEFEGGSFDLRLADGSFSLSSCRAVGDTGNSNPSALHAAFIPPVINCPLGTTAFVSSGDFNGDGIIDGRGFISVAPVPVSFVAIPPALKEEILLRAAPVSDLPASSQFGPNWEDLSVTLFYDYVNRPIVPYSLTVYSLSRSYGSGNSELQRMYREVVPGTYTYGFPRQDASENPAPFDTSVDYQLMIESTPGFNPLEVNNLFRLTNDSDWQDGKLLVDPRTVFLFQWDGMADLLPDDGMSFAIRDSVTNEILYPAYGPTTPETSRRPEIFPTPSTSFPLGANFFNIGDSATAELTVTRNFEKAISFSTDESSRTFHWDIRFIDSYQGFLLESEEAQNLPEIKRQPNFDADGDGLDNLMEYALQTDPFNADDRPVTRPELDPTTGALRLQVPIRPNTAGKLTYEVQFTTNLIDYTTITESTPGWSIEESTTGILEVNNTQTTKADDCFLRIKVTSTP